PPPVPPGPWWIRRRRRRASSGRYSTALPRGHVQDQVRSRPGGATVWHPIGGTLHLRVPLEVVADFLDRHSGVFERAIELALRAFPGLGQHHLAARERVDLRVALDLERRVDLV